MSETRSALVKGPDWNGPFNQNRQGNVKEKDERSKKKDERRMMSDECQTSPSFLSFSLSPPRGERGG